MEYISDDEYRQMNINSEKAEIKTINKKLEIFDKIKDVLCDCENCSKINELNRKLEVMETKARSYKAALEEISEYVTGDVEFDGIRLILEGELEEE